MQKDIFGAAISDYYTTKKPIVIKVLSQEFDDDEIPVPYLFRDFSEMPPIEQKALGLAKGKTLDVGCGAGSHALYLQNKQLNVTAIDTSAGAIDVCLQRGIKTATCEDFYDHNNNTYDTLLLLMNGSGIIGRLSNFNIFFTHIKTLLNPNGQVLIDSSDLIYLFEDENGEYWVDASLGYYGEMQYQLSYNNETSPPFDWLYVDYNTLQRAAAHNGFKCEVVMEGEHYEYLAKLTLE